LLHSIANYAGYSTTALGGDYCPFDDACTGVTVAFHGNTFFISGLFIQDVSAIDFFQMQYTIFNIPNPSTPSVGTFILTIFNGNTIYYPTVGSQGCSSPIFSAQTMTYSVSVLQSTIWSLSPLKIILNPSGLIDKLTFTFLTNWVN
jgi:hypothetical protein